MKLKGEVLEESEKYFALSNNTVNAAEAYSEELADRLGVFEMILGAVVVCIISFMVMDYADKKQLLEQNVNLIKEMHIDVHTGLPNKNRCEDMFNNEAVNGNVCIVMFDLNGLKATNDKLGHISGDALIKGFADILKNSIRGEDFIGRYGGDEFVAVIYNTDIDGLEKIFKRIEQNVERFNKENSKLNLSYAYGYSFSSGRIDCTMKQLLAEADENMYKNKTAMKKKMDYYDYVL